MEVEVVHSYFCPNCGEPNQITVDLSAGTKQQYVEDCAVCCRPNLLKIHVQPGSGDLSVEVEFEG
ncbi:MAG: CPXCG motif-containing cysteine-rich protein [Ignavibacteriales bacterium]|nr:CPXCG motif-containing cysteine-rich protein [Ignavibacteriales bacterium]